VSPRYIKGMNMRAYCHMRKEELDFRLDRIKECADVEREKS
jgi:predicted DNA-binding transcriptional regulator YafY